MAASFSIINCSLSRRGQWVIGKNVDFGFRLLNPETSCVKLGKPLPSPTSLRRKMGVIMATMLDSPADATAHGGPVPGPPFGP